MSPSSKPIHPSRWPHDGGSIDLLDKRLSAPVFALLIGPIPEMLLSLPGCFFGMPAFHVLGPTLVACSLGGHCATTASAPALVALAGVTLGLLAAWASVHSPVGGPRFRRLYMPQTMLAAPVVGSALAHWVAGADDGAVAAGSLYLLLWFSGIFAILPLKAVSGRRRPVASDVEHSGAAVAQATSRKVLLAIPYMMKAGDPNSSFPSGDVGGAVAFAYPLIRCGASSAAGATWSLLLPAAGVLCVLVSAFGRMYWQLHHLMDVCCGALSSVVTCVLVDAAMGATAAEHGATTVYWHPAAMLVVLFVYVKLTGFAEAAPVKTAKD